LNWTRQFVEARRKFLVSPQSNETISQWMDDPSIHMEQYIIPPDGFRSFNQFFIRDLLPGMRTVASYLDDSVLVSPNDCVLNMIEPLTPDTKIPTKLNQKLNVTQLLNGSKYARYFENGSAISCILMPTNYSIFEQFRRGYLDTIGSVVFEDRFSHVTDKNPVPVYKGEKLGHFEYGGSLVITLIQQGISSITTPQGQQIGVFAQCQECKAAP
jgi:phosphatidylserine decarboxylase